MVRPYKAFRVIRDVPIARLREGMAFKNIAWSGKFECPEFDLNGVRTTFDLMFLLGQPDVFEEIKETPPCPACGMVIKPTGEIV